MSTGLGREDIRALLDDLSAELAARGARAELFLVGGAALAVAYDATRATRDLDAVFIPTDTVRQAAAAVAQHRGLTEDWLNDAVKGFLPGPDPDAQRFYSSDSLIVDVASPRYLLAMKLFAARARELLDRVGGAHRAAPRSWPGGPSVSSTPMRPTQMSLTRGRGHQLGFHRAVMASLIAKGQCGLPGSRPQPDRGLIGRSVSPPPTSTAG